MARNTQAKALVKAARQLMAEERSLMLLPVLGTLMALVFGAALGIPAYLLLASMHFNFHLHQGNILEALLFAPATIASTFAVILCNSAIAIAAGERLRTGQHLKVSEALSKAWAKRMLILKWSVLSTAVGIALEQLRRFGLAGRIAAMIGSLAWGVAVFFVVPVLVFENLDPIQAVERSSKLFVNRFGQVARSQIRISVRVFGLAMLTLVAFLVSASVSAGFASGAQPNLAVSYAAGGVAVASIFAFFYLIIWSSTITSYLRTILYFYAADQEMPQLGVDMSQVFAN